MAPALPFAALLRRTAFRAVPAAFAALTAFAASAEPPPAQRRAAPAPPAGKAAAPAAATIPGCPSLANLRRILRDTREDPAAIAAFFADERADRLGCGPVARERVVSLADHVVLGGESYDCLGLKETVVCHWTRAGGVKVPPAKTTADKTTSDKTTSDKISEAPRR